MITLATLPTATAQEVFDQVVAHLRKQKAKSVDLVADSCVYYEPIHQRKCAAGCLIAEDEYSGTFEKQGWYSLVKKGTVPSTHCELIGSLQTTHDQYPVQHWEEQFRKLTNNFNLTYTPLP